MPTIEVNHNDRLAGVGSKQTTYTYDNASPIILVKPNAPNKLDSNAIIENLIIDGEDYPTFGQNTTGILLENVCNCLIRNLTIRNCDVGIKVQITGNGKAFGNRFEHIRMINVKTGILFTGTPSNVDFSYTTIDNVGISFSHDKNNVTKFVGIKVDSNANLYNAFVKATVWTSNVNHKGMEINGAVKYSLVNLEVEDSGTGVQINSGAVVSNNQSFLLTTLGLSPSTRKVNLNGNTDDIKVFAQ